MRTVPLKYAAIYLSRRVRSVTLNVVLGLSILIILCGDVETNPGPPKFNQELTKLLDEVKEMKTLQNELLKQVKLLTAENTKLKIQMSKLEDQSRRENLIFYGIPETDDNESWEKSENLIRKFMSEKMKVDNAMDDTEKGIQIERAHRISHTRSNKDAKEPRPIIVKFSR